ncbi:MAG: hypothetical protein H0Z38_04265 [Firmicutes bacterium]|nr:hypothetical protein [Bacillota bacterium]
MAKRAALIAEEIYPVATRAVGYEPAEKTQIVFKDVTDAANGFSRWSLFNGMSLWASHCRGQEAGVVVGERLTFSGERTLGPVYLPFGDLVYLASGKCSSASTAASRPGLAPTGPGTGWFSPKHTRKMKTRPQVSWCSSTEGPVKKGV